jgi:hypothetical protein
VRRKETFHEVHAVGIDLGKTLFHLVGVDLSGSVVVRKRCSRSQLLAYTANLRVQRIGMEACSGSHFLGRALPLRQNQQERLHRCGSHCRSRAAADHAFSCRSKPRISSICKPCIGYGNAG